MMRATHLTLGFHFGEVFPQQTVDEDAQRPANPPQEGKPKGIALQNDLIFDQTCPILDFSSGNCGPNVVQHSSSGDLVYLNSNRSPFLIPRFNKKVTMDTTTAVILVIILFAVIVIVAFLLYRQRGGAEISGPFGLSLKVKGSNDLPKQKAGISAKGITSHEGGVKAEETTGQGIEIENVDAKKDVILSSSRSTQLTSMHRRIMENMQGNTISVQNLSAVGNITIQQFVGSQVSLAEQLDFFIKHIGLENIRGSKFANAQFEAYCSVWKSLQRLRLAGEELWTSVTRENLLRFAYASRETFSFVREGEIFFDDEDRESLMKILRAFNDFHIGKQRLIQMQSLTDFENAWRNIVGDFRELPESRRLEIQAELEADIKSQIRSNKHLKEEYERLLQRIRASFRKRLSN